MLRHREMVQLVSHRVDPKVYPDTISGMARFRRDYQAVSLLSKLRRNIGLDTRKAAYDKWLVAEEVNRLTNRRIRGKEFMMEGVNLSRHELCEVLHLAKRKISTLLGPFRWRHVFDKMAFGPGATQETKGQISLFKKYAASAVSATKARAIASHTVGFNPHWYEAQTGTFPDGPCCLLGIVTEDSSSLTFVPKSAKTDRAIAIEHGLNIYIQKGIGAVIRKRLKGVDIDLDDQSVNQDASQRAYRERLATIDLSMASDTVSCALVEELLPEDWLSALDSVRSQVTRYRGETFVNNKFSSMGNGFTFELESMLFWAIASATQDIFQTERRLTLVYGDDIIVPQECAETLMAVLKFCGFAVNVEKTFVAGSFYESCGEHWFLGHDVSPFYIKEELDGVEDFFNTYNQILACFQRFGVTPSASGKRRVLGCVIRSVRPVYRFCVPIYWGADSGFHESEYISRPPFRQLRSGWEGFRFVYWGTRPETLSSNSCAFYCAKLDAHSRIFRSDHLQKESPGLNGNRAVIRVNRPSRRRSIGFSHSWS
jgi:hypothetical protein